jgi:hypothetical protein
MSEWKRLLAEILDDPGPAALKGARPMAGGCLVEVAIYNTHWIRAMARDRGLAA